MRKVKRGIKAVRVPFKLKKGQTMGKIEFKPTGRGRGFYIVPIYEPDKERMIKALKVLLDSN